MQDFITLIKNDILKDLIETHMHDSKLFIYERSAIVVKSKRKNIYLKEFSQEVQFRDIIKVIIIGKIVHLGYNLSKA